MQLVNLKRRTAALIAALAAAALLLSGCADPRQDIDLVALLNVDESSGFYPYVQQGSEATESFCSAQIPCIQAIETPYVRMSRFADRQDAEDYATTLTPSGYQSDWIVLEFTDQADLADREAIETGIDGLYRTDP